MSRIKSTSLMDIHDKSDLEFKDPKNETVKLYIRGPEYDAMGIYEDCSGFDDYAKPESVPEAHVEQTLKAISAMPALREVVIDPCYYSEDKCGSLSTSRLCWLLSSKGECKIEKLRVSDLDLHNQSDVEQLALAFTNVTSIKTICFDKLLIGYFQVRTLAPLMQALSKLPYLEELRIVFDAYGNGVDSNRHAQEALPVLMKSASLENVALKKPQQGGLFYSPFNYPEVGNRPYLDARI